MTWHITLTWRLAGEVGAVWLGIIVILLAVLARYGYSVEAMKEEERRGARAIQPIRKTDGAGQATSQ